MAVSSDVSEGGGEVAHSDRRLPTPAHLDDQLARQRLVVIRACAIPLMLAGAAWTILVLSGALGAPDGGFRWFDALSPVAMVIIGFISNLCVSSGRVRAAAYTLIVALLAIGTASTIAITNAELTSLVTYCVAMSVAAITLDSRQLAWVGCAIVLLALIGSLLHIYPVVEQVALPPKMEILAIFAGTVAGLPYPMAMFWMISSNLSASRSEAWQAARAATAAADVIEKRTNELQSLAEQLESKNAELNDFLYVVSHDLRAPLINLDGFSRSLEESVAEIGKLRQSGASENSEKIEGLEQEIAESLGFIVRSVRRMDFLVRAVLELSRLGTRSAPWQKIDTNGVVDDILGSFHFSIEQRQIEVNTSDLPIIEGDPVRVQQVFSNLIDNAIKYLEPAGEARIDVRCNSEAEWLHFVVRDNGVGIRQEDQTRIFRLFTRVGRPTAEGDGIGLTSVRKIIENRGGRIWVESQPGRGSEFHFTWPHPPAAEQNDSSMEEEDEHDAAA